MQPPESETRIDSAQLFEFYQGLQQYVSWTESDERWIRQAYSLVAGAFQDLIDDFYDEIRRHPDAVKVIRGGNAQIERLKQTLLNWIDELFSRTYDESYVASRWQVGKRHVLIGLDQTYATVALARLGQGMHREIDRNWQGPESELRQIHGALEKLLALENAIISAAYQTHFATNLQEQATRQIEQSERLASIGQMITGLAHESRNVLQRSHACLAALMLDIEELPDASKQATRIQSALDRLQMLYEEVRNYAAPIQLDLATIELQRLISGVWQNLASQWQEKNIVFQLVVPSAEAWELTADRFRLEQVFTNLLGNAIDASGTDDSIRCTLFRDEDQNTVVQIRDQGSGISESDQSRIFEPFFTTKPKGTGLGLAITKRIVESHGAQIQVLPDEPEGTCFEIRFPAH